MIFRSVSLALLSPMPSLSLMHCSRSLTSPSDLLYTPCTLAHRFWAMACSASQRPEGEVMMPLTNTILGSVAAFTHPSGVTGAPFGTQAQHFLSVSPLLPTTAPS